MYDDFDHDDVVSGLDGPDVVCPDLLTDDERTVGAAYARLVSLCEALMASPFSRHLYQELRDYLDVQAWQAADAFERIQQLGAAHVEARLRALEPDSLGEDWE
ncbi:hypothetical protein [Allosalinactinospora lopnorensis]|uniref:hypothetical protein n=1 Tax=Allosalinactinospora lopnorensis TaxID=1352348 RepID=UPI000623BBB8|nr:hypothetical protein [Allosalinactinospora lopnorensis]